MSPEEARVLAAFAALTDEKTGIIRRVEVVKITDPDPMIFLAHAEPCDTLPLMGISASNRGAACSPRLERAIIRACGESVERYCSASFNFAEMRLASECELASQGRRCVRVADLYPFADSQYSQADFPYRAADRTSRIRWVAGASVTTGEEVWVPASCVYVPYLFDTAVEPFTHMPISTGLAAGTSIDACIRKGILEILERDALMLVWHGRISVPRVDTDSCKGLSQEIDALVACGRAGGSRWYINLLTLDIDIPIISAALIDHGDPPLTSFGISADPDPVRALLLALEEATLTRMLLNRSSEILDWSASVPREVTTLREHLLTHARSPQLRQSLRFLTDAPESIRLPDLARRERPKSDTSLATRLVCSNLDAAWVDVTTPDVRDFGFSVVRTVMPGMQPLDNNHLYPHLGGSRLRGLTSQMGYRSDAAGLCNPNPHPFP